MSRPIAALDIDGVVADASWRLHHIKGHPDHDAWVRFFSAAGHDPVLAEGAELARTLAASNDIAWVTGRPERTRALTEHWLAHNRLPAGQLLMYPEHERRPAREVKLAYLQRLAATRQLVVMVDDDPRVIDRVEGAGLPAQLATWMPWVPALRAPEDNSTVVAAVVTSELGVLIGRRVHRQPPWAFLGGKVAAGESTSAAVIREVAEESGLHVTVTDRLGERVHPQTHWHVVYVACSPVVKAADARVTAPNEIAELRWVDLEELQQLLPSIYRPVQTYLERTVG